MTENINPFLLQIWLWTASEDFRSAELIEVPGRGTSYVLKSIKPHRLYALRIAAVGGGGFGRKTPTVYFTTGKFC